MAAMNQLELVHTYSIGLGKRDRHDSIGKASSDSRWIECERQLPLDCEGRSHSLDAIQARALALALSHSHT